MIKTSQPIVFFGTEEFSVTSLRALIDAGYPVAAVVTKPDTKKGRGQKTVFSPVKVLASQHNIPVLQPQKPVDIIDDLRAIPNPVGVLVSYGKIIPQRIIDLFSPGIINVHPSLLPLYRGPSPIESAILNGDDTTGVSIMQLTAKMDAGPVYTTATYPLTHTETQPDLYATLAAIGANLLVQTLPAIVSGTLKPTVQNDKKATYCSLLKKEDAILRPNEITAAQAERKVRAHLHYPKTKIKLTNDTFAIITKSHVTATKKTPLHILCKDGAFLSIDELVAPNGKRMTNQEFLRGYSHITPQV